MLVNIGFILFNVQISLVFLDYLYMCGCMFLNFADMPDIGRFEINLQTGGSVRELRPVCPRAPDLHRTHILLSSSESYFDIQLLLINRNS